VAKEVLEASGPGAGIHHLRPAGSGLGTTSSPTVQRDNYRVFHSADRAGVASIGAVDYLKSMVHTTAVNITKMFGITGRVISSCTACTTSSQSIGFGYETVRYGMQDAMLCGGADEYDTTTVAVFDNLLACSTGFNDEPQRTPRPFDVRRDGLVVGEGAGAVLLEEYESARRRGAPILAEVVGFACNNNGGDLILPNLAGIRETLHLALRDAGMTPGEIDLVSVPTRRPRRWGISSRPQAISQVYGDQPLVTA
jgi:3-oxoacyl-[acyl-carrier-protein] synthase II